MPFYSNGINGFVDVDDVVNISIQLMNSNIDSERFILVSQNSSFKEYFEKVAEELNVEPPKRALNKTTGKLFIILDWVASKFSNRKRGLTKEILKVSTEKFEYSNEKIKQRLNYSFIPLDKIIEKIAQKLKS